MAKITIRLPYPAKVSQYGDNAYYSGKHWSIRKRDSDYWHDLLLAEAPWDKGPLRSPVRITYYWNDRLDLSNHSIMAKMIEDGLKGRLFRDDSRKHVVEIRHRWHDGGNIKIEIEEVGEDDQTGG